MGLSRGALDVGSVADYVQYKSSAQRIVTPLSRLPKGRRKEPRSSRSSMSHPFSHSRSHRGSLFETRADAISTHTRAKLDTSANWARWEGD